MAIWAVGIMTLLMNVSTVIIFSLQPDYLVSVLGISFASLGLLEGTVEFFSWVTRVFSGAISDAIRRRKPLLLAAVALTTFGRGLFAAAHSLSSIFIARTCDRIANGLQASPRDALVGDNAPKDARGKSYGLRQALGMAGSTAGALIAYYLVQQDNLEYQHIFWIAAAFPALSFVIVLFYVKDHTHISLKQHPKSKETDRVEDPAQETAKSKTPGSGLQLYNIRSLSKSYWLVLFVAVAYMLSQYSGSFIILRSNEVAATKSMGPLVMIAQNVAAMLIAIPMGRLADRISHKWLLLIGFGVVVLANLIFFSATSKLMVLFAGFLWGAQLGTLHPLINAKIADVTLETNRGTGFGIYYISAGAAVFAVTSLVGLLRDVVGLDYAMLSSSIFAGLAMFTLPLLNKMKAPQNHKETTL